MKRVLVICLVGTVLCAGGAAAEIYRYTDSNGELHFVDDLGKLRSGEVAVGGDAGPP